MKQVARAPQSPELTSSGSGHRPRLIAPLLERDKIIASTHLLPQAGMMGLLNFNRGL
jgi:hypothetical protein